MKHLAWHEPEGPVLILFHHNLHFKKIHLQKQRKWATCKNTLDFVELSKCGEKQRKEARRGCKLPLAKESSVPFVTSQKDQFKEPWFCSTKKKWSRNHFREKDKHWQRQSGHDMGPLLSVGAKVVLARPLSCHVPRVFHVLHKDGEWLNNLPTLTKLYISTTDFRTVPLKRCYTSSSVDLSKLLLVAKSDTRMHARSNDAKHAFKLSVYRTYMYFVFI